MIVERPWEEYRLIKQVQALSQLPPSTSLRQVPSDEQELLGRLSSLEMNPVEWLEQTSSDLIGRVVLWRAVKDLEMYLQGAWRVRQFPQFYAEVCIQQRFGKLIDMPEMVEEIFGLLDGTRPTAVSLETLETVLQMLRSYYQADKFQGHIGSCDNKYLSLLIDLLNLPESVDITRWIIENHAHFAAIETVRYLISQVIPARTSLFDPFMKVLDAHVSASTNGLQVVLSEVAIGQHGFALTLQTKVPKALFQMPRDMVLAGMRWGAAEDVCDNQGYHYLVCYQLESHTGRGRTIYMDLQLLCYPSINPSASQITLTMDKIFFVGIGVQPRQRVQHHHEHVLQVNGGLAWSVDVRKMSTLQPRPWTDLIGTS